MEIEEDKLEKLKEQKRKIQAKKTNLSIRAELAHTELQNENKTLKQVLKKEYDETFGDNSCLIVEDVNRDGWSRQDSD